MSCFNLHRQQMLRAWMRALVTLTRDQQTDEILSTINAMRGLAELCGEGSCHEKG
jgi:hypothetical protein